MRFSVRMFIGSRCTHLQLGYNQTSIVRQDRRVGKLVNVTNNGFEERLGGLINIGPNTLPQTFNAEVTARLVLRLDNAVSEKEKEIARRKFSLGRLKLCVGNEAHRLSLI